MLGQGEASTRVWKTGEGENSGNFSLSSPWEGTSQARALLTWPQLPPGSPSFWALSPSVFILCLTSLGDGDFSVDLLLIPGLSHHALFLVLPTLL